MAVLAKREARDILNVTKSPWLLAICLLNNDLTLKKRILYKAGSAISIRMIQLAMQY